MAVVELGGGRARAADAIDPAVGFTGLAGLGAEVGPSAPLALVHARDEDQARVAVERLRAAYSIGAAPPAASDPVIARVVEGGA
jgi:thymidine phosphorylase